MSESKVPLPTPNLRFNVEITPLGERIDYTENQLRSYGDARAAEARRLALLEATEACDSMTTEAERHSGAEAAGWLDAACENLRALADETQPERSSVGLPTGNLAA